MARVANPYSEGEESDLEDQDYTVVSAGGESSAGSKAHTLVPGAVQHVHQVTLLPEGLRKARQLSKV